MRKFNTKLAQPASGSNEEHKTTYESRVLGKCLFILELLGAGRFDSLHFGIGIFRRRVCYDGGRMTDRYETT